MPKIESYFSKNLIEWYLENKRSLPWRATTEPYFIWLSEIMLQQTRVAQGLPYYLKFIKSFPTIHDLANASEEEVLKLWQGLGYYSRARNLHYTAKYISYELDGKFPDNYKDLLKLKGVGDYTASAIASICFSEPSAVVDGNVYRVLARYFGIDTPINSSEGIKAFKKLAQELIDRENPGDHNQAIMEFGARQCTPQNPNCEDCVFNDSCEALRTKRITELPVKLKKSKVKKRYFNYLVILSEQQEVALQQRTSKGIWHKLFEFPLVETEAIVALSELRKQNAFRDLTKDITISDINLFNETPIIHKLSHRHLYTRFWIIRTAKIDTRKVPINKLQDYAVPVLISNFVSEFSELNYAKK